jgi:hypothetical protein
MIMETLNVVVLVVLHQNQAFHIQYSKNFVKLQAIQHWLDFQIIQTLK